MVIAQHDQQCFPGKLKFRNGLRKQPLNPRAYLGTCTIGRQGHCEVPGNPPHAVACDEFHGISQRFIRFETGCGERNAGYDLTGYRLSFQSWRQYGLSVTAWTIEVCEVRPRFAFAQDAQDGRKFFLDLRQLAHWRRDFANPGS